MSGMKVGDRFSFLGLDYEVIKSDDVRAQEPRWWIWAIDNRVRDRFEFSMVHGGNLHLLRPDELGYSEAPVMAVIAQRQRSYKIGDVFTFDGQEFEVIAPGDVRPGTLRWYVWTEHDWHVFDGHLHARFWDDPNIVCAIIHKREEPDVASVLEGVADVLAQGRGRLSSAEVYRLLDDAEREPWPAYSWLVKHHFRGGVGGWAPARRVAINTLRECAARWREEYAK